MLDVVGHEQIKRFGGKREPRRETINEHQARIITLGKDGPADVPVLKTGSPSEEEDRI